MTRKNKFDITKIEFKKETNCLSNFFLYNFVKVSLVYSHWEVYCCRWIRQKLCLRNVEMFLFTAQSKTTFYCIVQVEHR